jgi:hypothetical protein
MKKLHWKDAEKRFGIWGVRDYYALLEQMAQEGAEVTSGAGCGPTILPSKRRSAGRSKPLLRPD